MRGAFPYHPRVTRARIAGLLASFAFVGSLFVLLPRLGAEEKKEGGGGGYRPLGLLTEVLTITQQNYVEPVDGKKLFAGAYSGMTDALDPVSEYVPADRMVDFKAAQAALKLPETVTPGLVLAHRFGYPVVVSAVPGSPAAEAGLKSDDVIEKVLEHTARGMALWDVEAHLTGKPGARSRLVILREGGKPRRRTVEVVLSSWSPTPPSASRVEGQTVVRIPSFEAGTAAAVKAAIASLDPTRPLVLDVRGTASGSLEEAARTAALFLPAGPLGELSGRRVPAKKFEAVPGERVHEGRLVLLVDSGTSGPAELFAGALRESGRPPVPAPRETPGPAPSPTPTPKGALRVRLVGEATPGLATELKVVPLQSGGALRLSVARVKTANGRSLSPRGLEPDDRVYASNPEEGQPAVDAALKRALGILGEKAQTGGGPAS